MGYYFSTEKLSVGYNGNAILKNIDIYVEKGEILTLIGPNGVGKTTILKNITKQIESVSGVVYIDKNSVAETEMKKIAKKMAVVITERPKTEYMTVEDVVSMGRYPYTGTLGILLEKDRSVVKNVMALMHIEEWKNKDFSTLSDGQKQRVMLARALAQEPEIIVLDEPTSFLDIRYKAEILSVIKMLAKEKKLTVIMSLHEVELAKVISDKIACFKNGSLDRFGNAEEIFKDNYITELYDIDENNIIPEFKQWIEKFLR